MHCAAVATKVEVPSFEVIGYQYVSTWYTIPYRNIKLYLLTFCRSKANQPSRTTEVVIKLLFHIDVSVLITLLSHGLMLKLIKGSRICIFEKF